MNHHPLESLFVSRNVSLVATCCNTFTLQVYTVGVLSRSPQLVCGVHFSLYARASVYRGVYDDDPLTRFVRCVLACGGDVTTSCRACVCFFLNLTRCDSMNFVVSTYVIRHSRFIVARPRINANDLHFILLCAARW